MEEITPPDVMRGGLHVLHMAMIYTRHWALDEKVSRQQIYDLAEAVHNIPGALARWKADESEQQINWFLQRYVEKWKYPDLISIYRQGKENPNLLF